MVPAHHISAGIRTFFCQSSLGYRHNMSSSMTAMAEEDGRTGAGGGVAGEGCSGTGGTNGDDEGEEGNLGTSDSTRWGSRREDAGGGDEGWLQLGIGASISSSTTTSPTVLSGVEISAGDRRERFLELNLFSDSPSVSRMIQPSTPVDPTAVSGRPALMPPVTILPTAYRRYPWDMSTLGMRNLGSTSGGSVPDYDPGRPQSAYPAGGVPAVDGRRNYEEVRVVSPPSRPQTGLWFVLLASQNQVKEPFLPQIPKSYLRIMDGMMTIRLLTKYLVSKLDLDNESEVEITCRRQLLPPHLTLQYVRDNIWCPRNTVVAMPPESAVSHVMTLHYTRSTSSATMTSFLYN